MLTLYEAKNEAAWLASFSFSVEVRPRYCECDAQGHVSNVVYPAYLELSRLQYFKAACDPEPFASFPFQHVTAELQLRYVAACYYDEPLRVASKLGTLGRSSATMEQAVLGPDDAIRILARIAIVRAASGGRATQPWSAAQRVALHAFDPGLMPDAVPQP
ncbi:MAG: thioesterase family protein [Vulcanimicrobiaceae bacterium]